MKIIAFFGRNSFSTYVNIYKIKRFTELICLVLLDVIFIINFQFSWNISGFYSLSIGFLIRCFYFLHSRHQFWCFFIFFFLFFIEVKFEEVIRIDITECNEWLYGKIEYVIFIFADVLQKTFSRLRKNFISNLFKKLISLNGTFPFCQSNLKGNIHFIYAYMFGWNKIF